MGKFQVHYDSNDGHHRWYNLQTCQVGLRWVTGVGVQGDFIKVKKSRVLSITRNPNG